MHAHFLIIGSIMFDPKHPDGNGENFFILRTYRAIVRIMLVKSLLIDF